MNNNMAVLKDKDLLREQIVKEIRRVASGLTVHSLPLKTFLHQSNVKSYQVTYSFGTWNRALRSAGLDVYAPHGEAVSDEELMKEIIRLTKELGKPPSEGEIRAFGKYSPTPYIRRWGSFSRGRTEALRHHGQIESKNSADNKDRARTSQSPESSVMTKAVHLMESRRRKKVQFGEPIDFRGLRFAPINEQGVVYLFGMISRELDFLIESIRTEYPDCEGKRCVNKKGNRWEHILIEFEYKSSNFRDHGHSSDDCDLIVCWIHDWTECPIEVLELKSAIMAIKT